jgi:hypothetical protein
MTPEFDLNRIERSARSAGYRDGLMEIYAAGVFFSLAAVWMIGPYLVGVAAALIILFFPKLVQRGKAAITYPRIGYSGERVDEAASTGRGMLVFMGISLAIAVVVVALTGGLGDVDSWRRAAPLFFGLAFSGGFWYAGEKSGLVRHRLIAVGSIALGIAFWWMSDGADYTGVAVFMAAMGAIILAVGLIALTTFVRRNPRSNDE